MSDVADCSREQRGVIHLNYIGEVSRNGVFAVPAWSNVERRQILDIDTSLGHAMNPLTRLSLPHSRRRRLIRIRLQSLDQPKRQIPIRRERPAFLPLPRGLPRLQA